MCLSKLVEENLRYVGAPNYSEKDQKAAKAELAKRLDGRVYETLLPQDAKPDLDTNKDIMEKFRNNKI